MCCRLFFKDITAKVLFSTLKKIKPKASCGVDMVSNKVLIKIAPVICPALVNIFNLSLCSGFVHCTLKTCVLKPLFKSGCKDDITNYRPIAILSAVVKLFEKCLCNQLVKHLDSNNIFYKHQYGFRAGHVRSNIRCDFTV